MTVSFEAGRILSMVSMATENSNWMTMVKCFVHSIAATILMESSFLIEDKNDININDIMLLYWTS